MFCGNKFSEMLFNIMTRFAIMDFVCYTSDFAILMSFSTLLLVKLCIKLFK